MAKTVVALYDHLSEAQQAVRDLVDSGYSRNEISLIAHAGAEDYSRYFDREGRYLGERHDDTDSISDRREARGELTPAEGAGAGAGIGATIGGIGGILMGLGLLAVPGVGPALAAGPIASALVGAGVGAAAGGLMGALVNSGVPEEEAGYYSEGVRRGGSLVMVRADDAEAERAIAILGRHNPVDIERRAADWRQGGWKSFSADAEPYSSEQIVKERGRYGSTSAGSARHYGALGTHQSTSDRTTHEPGDTTIEVVEEELQVGKRQTQEGGVRVESHVTETPVEQDVTLRKEHVHVERRPANRPANEGDFREQSIEASAVSEEAVVSKRARVIEEVVLNKDVTERTETVRDTVRRTDVDIQQLNADSRRHYDSTFATSDYDYDQYRPAYSYGHDLASHETYRNREWDDVEPEARRDWEERNPGTWEDFKDAVRQGWNQIRGRR